jgi:hypothetical protein
MSRGPRINDQFPIRESLSPPIVERPVPECAEAVYVTGFVAHATVRVFANLSELLAEEEPPFAFWEMKLNRPVKLGESLTATQTVGSMTSPHSIIPVIVSALPEAAVRNTKPDVGDDLYECGIIVPVGNLVPGVRVHVSENGGEIGNEPVAQAWHPVFTQPLHAAGKVTAQQFACEGTDHEVSGVVSDPVTVKAAPNPVPAPQVDAASLIPGNDTVTLTGLLVGAGAEIFDGGGSVSKGRVATGGANWFPIDPPLTGSSSITATQELCGNVSPPSDPVTPKGELPAPVVVGPICDGARFVVIRNTIVNATVVLMRNGSIVGYGGAVPGDLILALGGGQVLHTGQAVTAIQYMGPTISPTSNTVTVVARLGQPFVEILGGESFFLPKGGEQSIGAPVFPRGRGAGPVIRVQACCDENVRIEVFDPKGNLVAKPDLTALFPGYYTAGWPWSSDAGWTVPDGIPVGEYTVIARTSCDQQETRGPFYVIFNPADVGGPQRFSFDSTAVWFGTGFNSTNGLHYYLHPSDRRVFAIAIGAIGGMTDPYDAAIAVSRAEESLFAYSLNYHTQDVVDLIVNYTEAQCADDACCLTALLRGVGIPAHPVTADAGLETGAANWTFDTWVEFLAPHGGATDWRILHPHQYPGMLPESRGTFGATRGVATKGFNDVIVMANENWVFGQLDDGTSDVSYGRNGCNEPNQVLTVAPWIGELCEQGYWATPHWDCAGIQPRGLRAGNGFRLREGDLAFGGSLEGTVHVVNAETERTFGLLAVELVSHLPEGKAFVEQSFGEVETPVALDPGEAFALPFRLDVPRTLEPGRELYLRARLDQRTAVLHELRIPSRIAGEIELPGEIREGDEVRIRALIRNMDAEPVRSVDVDLIAPYALAVDRWSLRRFESLGPYEEREIWWTARAVAALASGSLRVTVATADAGGLLVRRPFAIIGRVSAVEAQPGFLPERQR